MLLYFISLIWTLESEICFTPHTYGLADIYINCADSEVGAFLKQIEEL